MYSKDWQSKLAAGAVLLAGIVATTALGADAPAPGAPHPRATVTATSTSRR